MPPSPDAPPLFAAYGLVKRYGALAAVDGVTFEVQAGHVHALIGPNGAGKSTLVHLVSGLVAADAGRVVLDGVALDPLPAHRRVHAGLARSFQVTRIFRDASVRDNLRLAAQASAGSSFRAWRPRSAERGLDLEAERLAGRVGLADRLDAVAGTLPHGAQRQLDVALALAARPKLLLLDEPMAGMGPAESAAMVELIDRLRHETTMLLVEHDMDAVFRLADRVSVLVGGRLLATGTVEEIRSDAAVQAAYLGEDGPPVEGSSPAGSTGGGDEPPSAGVTGR